MSTVQLRRYEIAPGELDQFVENWRAVLPLREKYGFRVLFAFADRETSQFVWAVSHDGPDFDAVEAEYHRDPARKELMEPILSRVRQTHVTKVDVVVAP